MEKPTSLSEEKAKKSKQFVKFLAKFIVKDRRDKEENSSEGSKTSLLELIRDFQLQESNKDLTDEDEDVDDNQQIEIENFVDEALNSNIELLDNDDLEQDEIGRASC